MIADTYNKAKSIAEQVEERDSSVVSESGYYEDAGLVGRPDPDFWPWPRLSATIRDILADCAEIHEEIGSLDELETETDADLVSAINELEANSNEIAAGLAELEETVKGNTESISSLESSLSALQETVQAFDLTAIIDDSATATTTTWSSSKISEEIEGSATSVKDELLGGAGEAYDTLSELAELIQTNQTSIAALQEMAAGHVDYDEAQELTEEEQAQARSNIGALGADEEAASAAKLGSETVGGTAQGIWLDEGVATAMSGTVGDESTPVYLNAGVITACTSVASSAALEEITADYVDSLFEESEEETEEEASTDEESETEEV